MISRKLKIRVFQDISEIYYILSLQKYNKSIYAKQQQSKYKHIYKKPIPTNASKVHKTCLNGPFLAYQIHRISKCIFHTEFRLKYLFTVVCRVVCWMYWQRDGEREIHLNFITRLSIIRISPTVEPRAQLLCPYSKIKRKIKATATSIIRYIVQQLQQLLYI